jgi:large subunit ribosomal protein L17
LIKHEQVVTTKIKAKAVTPVFEKLITRAKTDSIQNRRMVQAYVQESTLVTKLFGEIAPRYKSVAGGYTKLVLIGNRRGDNAPMVRLALTKKAAVAEAKSKEETKEVAKTKKTKAVAAVVPEVMKATGAAPKLVRRTGKRGDK